MIIRRGLVTDLFELSRLWLEMVKELAPELKPNVDWWIDMARNCLNGNNYFILMAEENKKAVGFIDWFSYPEPATGKLHAVGQHFYVIPEMRKGNTAGRLYQNLLRFSKKQNNQVLELFCFSNEIALWKKHGFNCVRNLMRKEVVENV